MDITLEDIAAGIKYAIDSQKITSLPRPYLGMSQLGHKCSRYLWYYFRWAATSSHDARRERIFRRGDLEEPRIYSYLKSIGIDIVHTQEAHYDCNGHLSGHTDGIIDNVPDLPGLCLLEIKTMSEKYFKQLEKNGVKQAKPEYYCQVQTYMYYSNVKYALHITVNKNTEDLYIEIIEFNEADAQALVTRAADIINSEQPPPKVSQDPSYYMCGWCDFKAQCHEMAPYERTCRTCIHATPSEDRYWRCDFPASSLDLLNLELQKQTCEFYDVIKG
jgi:hypothetical protein